MHLQHKPSSCLQKADVGDLVAVHYTVSILGIDNPGIQTSICIEKDEFKSDAQSKAVDMVPPSLNILEISE